MVAQNFVHLAHPVRIQGNVIEAYLPGTYIGEVCEVQRSLEDSTRVGLAQVIGFNHEYTLLSLLNDNQGFSRRNVLYPTGKPFKISLNDDVAGAVLDAMGNVRARLDNNALRDSGVKHVLAVQGEPKDFTQRRPIDTPLVTGIRAIDGVLTCGLGQRMGIFASAGCGKTSLMSMLIENSEADIYVIGLIGERGREVTEFIETLKQSPRRTQVVLVYATSDRSCIERYNAAQIATRIAEYFSAKGMHVLLFIDSITRYARALRDTALSMGEMPARRGYPASVFEALPKLLERPGRFQQGSITAFYTVLIENEEEPDVIGDEVRSILDGHIYLSKKLAAQAHYPAIDILQSISRVFFHITQPEQQRAAARFRELLFRQRDMQLYLDLGEYQPGENAENDTALNKKELMENFLKQDMRQKIDIKTCLDQLYACLA
ncbi:type III secretion system ATPase SctN [Candidatus Symbiopectobacterium sp. NZEC135]|uniref:type III secretion system ATPase SctN n=1 Tax=Candidatus Symbiopectobacterium sp. NZEC135 TaxID=2820471 RepID=UPI002226678F|nr:type III secretion system ATPase SctN [Candidatus Symbiopectobacterium sp. NZEC135]MCW2478379.1 type III secretion system ATPase SctN [Candidatus Symbiopectobacterium sp. NZEC135]